MRQRILLAAAALVAANAPAAGESHRFTPREYHTTFSFAHAPVLKIKPGDVLVVRLERIEPNRATAWTDSLLAPYTVDPAFLRYKGLREQKTVTWNIDREKRIAWIEEPGVRPGRIEVPLRPMLGCIATAPANKEAIHTSTPGPFGGNMDYNGMNAGVKVMLPVSEPGALLFLGDGHAVQGDGEVLGNASEISMDVEFAVDLIKKKSIAWPRLENDEYLVVLGSATTSAAPPS